MKKNKSIISLVLVVMIIMGGITLSLMLISTAREQNNTYIEIQPALMKLPQLDEPKEGDPIAVVDTTLGEIRFVLYPQYSPDAVKNFTDLAESGYYDGTYVFDSVSGAYSGLGAKSKDGSTENGLDQHLWPFRGAVCMVTTAYERTFKEKVFGGGTYYCGSRFDIMNSIEFNDETSKEIREASAVDFLADAFIEKGGIPNFSQQMTIIGQTYEGFDVVDALANLPAKPSGTYMTPDEDVLINSITISTYSPDEEVSAQS